MRNGPNPEPLLEVRGLTAGFDAGPVLFGIDLDVGHGELVALVGANGAGKSTLLGALSGLIRATSGSSAPKPSSGRASPTCLRAAGCLGRCRSRRTYCWAHISGVIARCATT